MKKVRLFSLIVLMLPIILQISLRAKAAPDAPTMSELPSQRLASSEIISKRSTSDGQLLALYALAFDNSPVSDLSWAYAGTITGLQEATVNQPNKIVLALVDMPGQDNTFILRIENGERTTIEGLPDMTGALTTTIQEYDMTDGAMLGGFLLWARTNDAADKTTFSYIGHGGPLIPEADWTESLDLPPYGLPFSPLPSRLDLKGSLADITPEPSLLSLHSLSEALRIGTNEGDNPIDVLDLVHCFASTIEEYYALHAYTKTMTGSPNYSYYGEEMPGQALSAIEPSASADEIAQTILQQYEAILLRYDSWLDSEDYPRLMVAVDSSQIPAIKQIWDEIAEQIMTNFDRTKLENAYLDSDGYYDTTHCDQDWQLEAPDAVVDLGKFAFQLGEKFSEPVSSSVEDLQQVISDTIIVRVSQNGEPWFATTSPKPYWNFDGNAGIGIYADFVGTRLDEDNDGQEDIHLTWQGSFYTDTAVITNTSGVEVPQYAFLQPAEPNGVTWAHVFDRFWQGTNNLQFDSCLLESQTPNMTELEVTISSFPETVEVGEPLTYLITVTNQSPMTATQTTLVNILPNSVNLIEAHPSKGICSELPEGITCHLGTISHTEIATVTITVNPTQARWITNAVNVSNYMPDINVLNDMVIQELEVLPSIPNVTLTQTPTATPTASPPPWQADLSIEQSDMPDPVAPGLELTYVMTVTNLGPASATNVSLLDDLPDGVEFVSVTASQGICSEPSNNEFTCELASLASLESATVVLVVQAQERGVITNTVNVENAVPDPNLGNNSSVKETTVEGAPMIHGVYPPYGLNDRARHFGIKGQGFESSGPPMVTLDDIALENVTRINSQLFCVIVPAGLESGWYDITVDTSFGTATLDEAYEVLDANRVYDLRSYPEWLLSNPLSLQNNTSAPESLLRNPLSLQHEANDLYPSSESLWTSPLSLRAGYSGMLGLFVEYFGCQDEYYSIVVEFRLNSAQGEVLGRTDISSMPSFDRESTEPLMWEPETEGDYTICAIIDPDNQIEEADENNNVICRTITVLPFIEDPIAPVIDQCMVADGAETTEQLTVPINVTALDFPITNTDGVRAIKVIGFEYNLGSGDWIPVQESGWIPYALANQGYEWTLLPIYGNRKIEMWAMDSAENISLQPCITSIELLPSQQEGHVSQNRVSIYRTQLEQGDILTSTLMPIDGDPDLYIWGSTGQSWYSNQSIGVDSVQFEVPSSGMYQIEVHGHSSATYRLNFATSSATRTMSRRQVESNIKPRRSSPAVPLDEWPSLFSNIDPYPVSYQIYLPILNR